MTPDDRDRLRALAEGLREEALRWPLIEQDLVDDGYPGSVAEYVASLDPKEALLALLDDLRDAEAERDRLRAALEFYSNRHNYEERVREFRGLYGEARHSYVQPIEEDDYGARARAALATDPPAGT